jgi:hypothetical protein
MLVRVRVVNKKGYTLDEQEIWQALIDCFSKHPYLDVSQAAVFPDKDYPVEE